VRLPRQLYAEAPPEGGRPPTRRARTTALGGISLLVVDDDADALDLFAEMLRQGGADVRAAPSVRAALDILERWEPDVVVSDIEMPGESGYALIHQLRGGRIPHGDRIPVVAVTAYGGVTERIKILSAGFDSYIAKPVEPDELAAVIGRLVTRARALRPRQENS
jgi:CheY-like chemotaxis protein